jgi:hypothetical protein
MSVTSLDPNYENSASGLTHQLKSFVITNCNCFLKSNIYPLDIKKETYSKLTNVPRVHYDARMQFRNSRLLDAATERINSPGTETFIRQKGFVYKINSKLRDTCKHFRKSYIFL